MEMSRLLNDAMIAVGNVMSRGLQPIQRLEVILRRRPQGPALATEISARGAAAFPGGS